MNFHYNGLVCLKQKMKQEILALKKLALSDEILMKVEKPARYIGNELNSVVKDKDADGYGCNKSSYQG